MKGITILLLFVFATKLYAQQTQNEKRESYPTDYFRNPLNIPIFLAGNFGECRPGHFHSGVDIKTLGEENQPVHAAAEGYISRIKMEKGGFGHGIYITHPSGYTTLYAHLNNFAPEIQKYVKEAQYAQKKWDVDLQFSANDFPVEKGQQIAWSGNTGSSTAPHLHFEIRDSKTEHPLNPELFGLPIADKTQPVLYEVVLYSGKVYEDSTLTITLAKKGNQYKPIKTSTPGFTINNDTIEAWNTLTGVGINEDDFMEGSDNTLAPYLLKLYMDDSIQSQVTLDDIGYDETRYINGYADYKTHEVYKKWIQCLFQLPGNRLNGIYSNLNSNKGRLNLADGKIHKIKIEVIDDKNNASTISFFVKPAKSYTGAKANADAIKFQSTESNYFTDPNLEFALDAKQLYDDIFFRFNKTSDNSVYSDRFMLHYSYVPLHHYFDLRIKPNKPIPFDLRNKVVLRYSDGKSKDDDGKAATFTDKGWYVAKVRNFGTYWLDIDTIPPTIKPLQKTTNFSALKQITFEAKDDMTSVKSFAGHIDGKWVCFEQHGNLFFYKFDEHCPKGKHNLVLRAEDENGNSQTYRITFTR